MRSLTFAIPTPGLLKRRESGACIRDLDPHEIVLFRGLYDDLSSLHLRLKPVFYGILHQRLKQHGREGIAAGPHREPQS